MKNKLSVLNFLHVRVKFYDSISHPILLLKLYLKIFIIHEGLYANLTTGKEYNGQVLISCYMNEPRFCASNFFSLLCDDFDFLLQTNLIYLQYLVGEFSKFLIHLYTNTRDKMPLFVS